MHSLSSQQVKFDVHVMKCLFVHTILLQELYHHGFLAPTVAQMYGWPYIDSGQDITLIAPSGTGKTLAYLLPLLTKIDSRDTFGVS